MPTILSGAVVQTGSSSSFITLAQAQPALQITPSTNTGYTIIVNTASNIEYTNLLGSLVFDSGTITNYNSGTDIGIYNLGGGFLQVYTSTFLNNTSAVTDGTDSYGTTSGAFVVTGGVGIGKNLNIGGITTIAANIASNSTQTGSLVVGGGFGVGGDIYVGGNLVFTNAKQGTLTSEKVTVLGTYTSVSTTTGAVVVQGGVGIGGSLYSGPVYDNGNRVVSVVNAGRGIAVSTSSGPTVLVTNTGVLTLTAGTGTVVNTSTGDITVWINPTNVLLTLQQVTNAGNTTNLPVYFNNQSNAISSITGAVVVAGGVGISQDLYIGGNITANGVNLTSSANSTLQANNGIFKTLSVTGTNFSTTTFSNNALYVAGGAGVGSSLAVGGDAVIYGNLYVQGTYTTFVTQNIAIGRNVIALSTASGPAILANGSGITVGPVASPFASFLYDGITSWQSLGSINPTLDLAYNLGSSGLRWNTVYGGSAIFNDGANSISTQTGALVVQGGIGVSGDSLFAGEIKFTSPLQATSTLTGALIIQGGVGIGGSIYAGNIYSNGILLTSGGGGGGGTGTINLIAGADIALTTTTQGTVISNTSTLQTVTSRGNTTINPIVITNGQNSYNATSGALQVAGGGSFGSNLWIGGNSYFNGYATQLFSTNTFIYDNIVDLHFNVNNWTYDDGKDIGLKFNYYYGASTATGFLGRSDASGHLVWFSTGNELANGKFTGTGGVFETGSIQLNSTSTASITSLGGIAAAGPLYINNSATISGTIYAGPIFSNYAPVLTSANLSSFGVADIIAGTGTSVSSSTGNVIIWNTLNLNQVSQNGNTTSFPIGILNGTNTYSTATGALTVSGGVGVNGGVFVGGTVTATNATFNNLAVQIENISNSLTINSTQQIPLQITNPQNGTSTVLINAVGTDTNSHGGLVIQNNLGNYLELGINSSGRTISQYGVGSAYLYTNPFLPSLNIGNSSTINFWSQNVASANPPAMSIASTTTTIINNLLVEDNSYSSTPSAGIIIQSNATTSHGSLTFRNVNANGQSYTWDVGGNNRAGGNGSVISEGSLTLFDDIAGVYRLAVHKGSGAVLINQITDDGFNKLQVTGGINTDNLNVANSATIGQSLTVGVTTFNGFITVNTSSIFNGVAKFYNTASFYGPVVITGTVVIGSSALQTSVTLVNTTNPTSIDSFDSTLYRSAKSLVQIEDLDNGSFYVVEVVLLVDNASNVYISQYGIITTASPLGDFSTGIVGNNVVLYFTAYDTTNKKINVVQTAISV